MPELSSKYTFRIDIEGAEALERAKAIRAEIRKELEGVASDQKVLAEAYQRTNEAITSQTRRWSYHKRRIGEVQEAVVSLNKALIAQITLLSTLGRDAFDPLVQSARKAYDDIIGHSIIPELTKETIAFLKQLRDEQMGTFDILVSDAIRAGVTVDDLIDRISRLRRSMRLEVEHSPLMAILDKFVEVSEIVPVITMKKEWGYGGEVGVTRGLYFGKEREIQVALAEVVKGETVFRSALQLLNTFFHELGHTFSDFASRVEPLEANLARYDFTTIARREIEEYQQYLEEIAGKQGLGRKVDFAYALGELFADEFARFENYGAAALDKAMRNLFIRFREAVVREGQAITPEAWSEMLRAGPTGRFLQQAAQLPTTKALVPTMPVYRGIFEEAEAGRDIGSWWSQMVSEAVVFSLQALWQGMDVGLVSLIPAVFQTHIDAYMEAAFEELAGGIGEGMGLYIPPSFRGEVRQLALGAIARIQKEMGENIFRPEVLLAGAGFEWAVELEGLDLPSGPPIALPPGLETALVPTMPVYRGIFEEALADVDIGSWWSATVSEAVKYSLQKWSDELGDVIVNLLPTVYRAYIDAYMREAFAALSATEEWGMGLFIPPSFRGEVEQLTLGAIVRIQQLMGENIFDPAVLLKPLLDVDWEGYAWAPAALRGLQQLPSPPIALPPPKPPQWFLDLASGEPDARRWDVDYMPPGAKAVAVDIDVSLSPDVVADALALPFKEHIFNEIYIGRILSYVAEKEFPRLAEEVARVSAGKIEVADYADIIKGFRFPTFVKAILERGFELVGDEAIDYVEDIAEMLAEDWSMEELMDPGAGFRRRLTFQRPQVAGLLTAPYVPLEELVPGVRRSLASLEALGLAEAMEAYREALQAGLHARVILTEEEEATVVVWREFSNRVLAAVDLYEKYVQDMGTFTQRLTQGLTLEEHRTLGQAFGFPKQDIGWFLDEMRQEMAAYVSPFAQQIGAAPTTALVPTEIPWGRYKVEEATQYASFRDMYQGAVLELTDALSEYVNGMVDQIIDLPFDWLSLEFKEGVWTAADDLATLLIGEFSALLPEMAKWSVDAIAAAFRQVAGAYDEEAERETFQRFIHEQYVQLVEQMLERGFITQQALPQPGFPLWTDVGQAEWWKQLPPGAMDIGAARVGELVPTEVPWSRYKVEEAETYYAMWAEETLEHFKGAVLEITKTLEDFYYAWTRDAEEVTDYSLLELKEGMRTAANEMIGVLVGSGIRALFPAIGKWTVDAIAAAFRQVIGAEDTEGELRAIFEKFTHEQYVQLVEQLLERGLLTQRAVTPRTIGPQAPVGQFELWTDPEHAEWWKQLPPGAMDFGAGRIGELVPQLEQVYSWLERIREAASEAFQPLEEGAGRLDVIMRGLLDTLAEARARFVGEAGGFPALLGGGVGGQLLLAAPEGAGVEEYAQQLERVRNVIYETKEISPGVYAVTGDEAEEAAPGVGNLADEMERVAAAAGGAGAGAPPGERPPGGFGQPGGRQWGEFTGDAQRGAKATLSWAGALDIFTQELNKATLQFFGIRRVGYAFEHMGRQLSRAGESLIDTLVDGVFAYQEFNEASVRAGAAMELPREQMGMLEDAIIATSISLGLFDPLEIAEGYRVWAAGTGMIIRNEAELQAMTEQTTKLQMLAAMNNEQLGDVMRYTGGIIAEFNMDLSQTSRVAEVLNFVAAKTFAEVSDVGEAFAYVGPLAHAMGMSFEETAAALALMSDENIKGTRAGRALQQILRQILDPTNKVDEAMQDAFVSTKNWRDLIFPGGEFVGFAEFIDYLAAATEGYTQEEKNAFLATITTANATATLVALVDKQIAAREIGINTMRAYENTMLGVQDAETRRFRQWVEYTTGMPFTMESAHTLMARMTDDYMAGDFRKVQQMQIRWETATLVIGRSVQEWLTPVMTVLAETMQDFAEFVEKYPEIGKALAVAGGFLVAVGVLSQTVGALAGMAANVLIFGGAVTGFTEAVVGFQLAITQLTGKEFLGMGGMRGALGGAAAGVAGLLSKASAILIGTWIGAAIGAEMKERDILGARESIYLGKGIPGILNILRDGFIQLEGDLIIGWINLMQRLGQITEEEAELQRQQILDLAADFSYAGHMARKAGEDVAEAGRMWVGAAGRQAAYLAEYARTGQLPGVEGPLPGVAPSMGVGVTKAQREAIKRWEEYLDDEVELREKYDDKLEDLQDKHLKAQGKAYDAYLRSRADAIEDYAFRELRIEEDHQRSLVDIRERYEQNVIKIHEKYAEAIEKAEEQRQDRITQYLEDYHKKMERMRLDHIWRMEDFIRERDARGALLEMRSYKRKVREAEEDRDDWLKRQKGDAQEQRKEAAKARDKALAEAKKDLEKQLKEQQEQFERQRERREEDFQRRLDEMKENYDRQVAEREQQYEDSKQDLKDAKAEELEALKDATFLELQEILDLIADTEEAEADSYTRRLKALEEFYRLRKAMATADAISYDGKPPWVDPEGRPPRQYGGYAYGGIYRVGEAGREFILDYPTTRALERFIGPLSQSRIIGAFAGDGQGRGGGLRIEVNQAYWTFQGSFTAEEKLWFQEAARQAAYDAVDDVVHEVMGA